MKRPAARTAILAATLAAASTFALHEWPPHGTPNSFATDCRSRLDNFEVVSDGKIKVLGMTAAAPCTNVYKRGSGLEVDHLDVGQTVNTCRVPAEPDRLNLYLNGFSVRPGFVYLSNHTEQLAAQEVPPCPAILPNNM